MSYADEIIYIRSQCNSMEFPAPWLSEDHTFTKGVSKILPLLRIYEIKHRRCPQICTEKLQALLKFP